MANKRKYKSFQPKAGASAKDVKRAKAKHYSTPANSSSLSDFTKGHEAILCTCDPGKEKQCRREMMDALERMYDEVYGNKKHEFESKDEEDERQNITNIDNTTEAHNKQKHQQVNVASALQAELAALKAESAPVISRHQQRKHSDAQSDSHSDSSSGSSDDDDDERQNSESIKPHKRPKHSTSILAFASEFNYRGVVLLLNARPKEYSLLKLVQHLLHRTLNDALQLTRFTVRLEPIGETCFSSMDALIQSAEKQLSTTLNSVDAKPCEYAIVFQRRGENEKMLRDDIIQKLAAIVRPEQQHKVNLKNPDTVLLVQVAGRMSGLSVCPQWRQLLKYNLRSCIETACGIVQQPKIIPNSRKQQNSSNDRKSSQHDDEQENEDAIATPPKAHVNSKSTPNASKL
jgi:tRNA(Ser,Leu) C12 N-acetylase TAN1